MATLRKMILHSIQIEIILGVFLPMFCMYRSNEADLSSPFLEELNVTKQIYKNQIIPSYSWADAEIWKRRWINALYL